MLLTGPGNRSSLRPLDGRGFIEDGDQRFGETGRGVEDRDEEWRGGTTVKDPEN